jgi:hypothetical protein
VTIKKGEPWGATVDMPARLRYISDDASIVVALSDGSGDPVAVTGGDLHRTVGGRDPVGADQVLELPIDLLRVMLDGGEPHQACAHVLIQSPPLRGGWWRGPVVMVMNAEFIGDWHVVARGHPNDGRAESCTWGADFGLRQRWEARQRLPGNQHVPHPQIETRSFRERTWDFDQAMQVRIDGAPAVSAKRVDIVVESDAATIYA